MKSQKSFLAAGMLVLLVSGSIALLRYGERDRNRDGMYPAPPVGTEAGEVERTIAADEATRPSGEPYQRWVLELNGRTGGRDREASSGSASGAVSGDDLAPFRDLPTGTSQILFAVHDASGQPRSDVQLQLKSLAPGGGVGRVVTDARGEAEFRKLAGGPYEYRAETLDGVGNAFASFRLGAGERKRLTLRLVRSGLSIAGRVRSQRGKPVSGIVVSLERRRFSSAGGDPTLATDSDRRARIDSSGRFDFGNLQEGEYELVTNATSRYLTARMVVQSGAEGVDLIVTESWRVAGTVTDSLGEPLDKVWVGLDSKRDRSTLTDADGHYVLRLDSALGISGSRVRFYLRGYEVELLSLPTLSAKQGEVARLDARLLPLEEVARVNGRVKNERGQPIEHASIALRSKLQGTLYHTVTDREGSFLIEDVKPGAGYTLRVFPRGPFLDYDQHQIRVPEEGRSFEITLKSLETGRLVGRMVDELGSPIAGFRMWVTASGATQGALPISGDAHGSFRLEEAPAGSLVFDTRSSPRLTIRGVDLPAGEEREVVLVLDSGEKEVAGHVVAERGEPISGALVSLAWFHTNGNVRSSSQRTTLTHPDGAFRFQHLGPGDHRLQVRNPGYRSIEERLDVGSHAAHVEIRLESDER